MSQENISNLITNDTSQIVADILGVPFEDLRIQSVSGGYSRNRRSIIGNVNRSLFVKEVDTDLLPDDGSTELMWLTKDHRIMEALRGALPDYVPEHSELAANGHALVMTAYPNPDWLWSPPTDQGTQSAYIQSVVDATVRLETFEFDPIVATELQLEPFLRDEITVNNGIDIIRNDDSTKKTLIDKYRNLASGGTVLSDIYASLATGLSDDHVLRQLADDVSQLALQPNDCFGHCDVRSDNLAFNPATGKVKFVDWNWASYTPRGFGATEFLISIRRSGIDVSQWNQYLNAELLAGTVVYYALKSLKEPFAPGSTLREMQADAAAVAFSMYTQLTL